MLKQTHKNIFIMENFPYKEVMKLAAKYQEFLNKNEDKVMFICWEKIKPLLDKNFYIEAKKELNNFLYICSIKNQLNTHTYET